MNKVSVFGLVMLGCIGLSWAAGTCQKYTSDAYRLSGRFKQAGLPVEQVEAGDAGDGYQKISVRGRGFGLMLMSMGSAAVFDQFAGMMKKNLTRAAPLQAEEAGLQGRRVVVYLNRPLVVLAAFTEEGRGLEATVDRVLEGFDKLVPGQG